MDHKELFSGLIRLHILHHAAQEEIYGIGIMEELARHGYKLSPGTLYPLLHGMEKRGYLKSKKLRKNGKFRRVYHATPLGMKALGPARKKVLELLGELVEG